VFQSLFYALAPGKKLHTVMRLAFNEVVVFQRIHLGSPTASFSRAEGPMTVKRRILFTFAALITFFTPCALTPSSAAEQVQYKYAVANGATEGHYVPIMTPRRRRYLRSHRYYASSRPRYVVKRRSRAKSVAIVGGSAAAGAGIGALAGGGKGAGIGAIAGGAAGLIYDRKTHKKVVRQY
jgi:hypothetical protein